jgi:hypothetical protein
MRALPSRAAAELLPMLTGGLATLPTGNVAGRHLNRQHIYGKGDSPYWVPARVLTTVNMGGRRPGARLSCQPGSDLTTVSIPISYDDSDFRGRRPSNGTVVA